VSYWIDPTLR